MLTSDYPSTVALHALRVCPDAVMFDWDDTLSDHAEASYQLMVETAQHFGAPPLPPIGEFLDAWYADMNAAYKRFFPGHTREDVYNVYKQKMNEQPLDKVKLFDGVIELLENLKSRGIPLFIVSNKPPELLNSELQHLGVRDYFEVVMGAHEERGNRKPSPYPIIAALKEANEKRQGRGEEKLALGNIWFVGDSIDDALASRSDGIQRFIVGHRQRALVESRVETNDPHGTIHYIDNISRLNEFVSRLPSARTSTISHG